MRSAFDQVCPIINSLSSRKAVSLAIPPPACKTFGDVMKSKYLDVWQSAIFEQYDKNAALYALSIPFSINEVPPDTKILRSLLVP